MAICDEAGVQAKYHGIIPDTADDFVQTLGRLTAKAPTRRAFCCRQAPYRKAIMISFPPL